jgi:hypothetical protein
MTNHDACWERITAMATEHVPHPNEESAAPTRHGYRIGPEDMEEFVNLPPEEQRRLADTPGALEAWLAARSAALRVDVKK